jgi:hypothetical protein
MQLASVLRPALGALLFSLLAHHTIGHAQSPVMLSAPHSTMVFELVPTPSMARHLTPVTTAKLATPTQYAQNGLTYPVWLSDASFSVKTRTHQRQTIVVATKRGNPTLTTDLLLSLNNQGVRSLEPQTVLFDTVSPFAGEPMPPATTANQPDLASGFADSLKSSALITFPLTVATTSPVPARAVQSLDESAITPPTPALQATRTKKIIVALAQQTGRSRPVPTSSMPTTPMARTSQPLPAVALVASAPIAVAPPLPSRSPPMRPPVKTASGWESWLEEWPLIAGAAAALVLLIYLAMRLWRSRAKRQKSNQAPSSELLPENQAANTVFGLSDQEADAMHKKWLSQKILQKM